MEHNGVSLDIIEKDMEIKVLGEKIKSSIPRETVEKFFAENRAGMDAVELYILTVKEQEYVTAAKALGASNSRIIKRHLLPNCVGQLVIATCLQIPSAIFLESFLSFLGLGVSAPMASLGSLCSDAIDSITLYPYRMIFPAVILTVLVLSLNLVGDGLRDALDPRLKK
jgi:ABC-type dipeptide/oligopeptide/nickel transport system permease subunit